MANSDLPIRFSDETYATKFEVSKALGTSLVDTIWSNILNYRSHFTRVLSLRNIEKNPLNVVLTPSILERCNALERKLNKVFLRYARMDENDPGKRKIKVDNYGQGKTFNVHLTLRRRGNWRNLFCQGRHRCSGGE